MAWVVGEISVAPPLTVDPMGVELFKWPDEGSMVKN